MHPYLNLHLEDPAVVYVRAVFLSLLKSLFSSKTPIMLILKIQDLFYYLNFLIFYFYTILNFILRWVPVFTMYKF